MIFTNLTELRNALGSCLTLGSIKNNKFPVTFTLCRGHEIPKYVITITEEENDFFIDSKGHKWVRDTNNKSK